MNRAAAPLDRPIVAIKEGRSLIQDPKLNGMSYFYWDGQPCTRQEWQREREMTLCPAIALGPDDGLA